MNFLKKILSYLYDIPLESTSSPYNPVLKLILSRGQIKLVSASAVYSYGTHYYNFRDSFNKLKIRERNIKTVLILGLGTGSVIKILEEKFNIAAKYDVVEIDPVVVALFNHYVYHEIKSEVKICTQDAAEFMMKNKNQYDLICMDIFRDNRVPKEFESVEFLYQLKEALKEDGLLLYNRLAIDPEDGKMNAAFNINFQKTFPQAQILKLIFNWMFYAYGPDSTSISPTNNQAP